ncbi:catechol 1,2-dioxygenase [Rhodococcus sp. 1.20]|jgi:2,3-dihydroxyphenylpropionate 1,2-dioxygenase|uniref:DODA-type extradiol aromatic ring-opening family dioxygenase n=1 Tax=Rhodococcus TaxID=1827 RepID=UPI00067F499A|nr:MULTISPECIES: catechol 1,2-dioxygenase [Rhodococcus]AUS29977.1 catechol 1,2-dioxygenase [Rhodococcus qingshengii]MCC4302320.1 catechol 1,2-dioxygenase [Rhodococcus sp. 3-2]MDI9943019.1 catechol 1,2-dioxygenase [Rhodococcus sp. IEGM 1302]OMQ31422.1 catechol 1,2-dioxygenase [Rhodococcus sp. D-1]QEM29465.1 catechol 1,2-dioxygenase [Rhodococcus qingshengii]
MAKIVLGIGASHSTLMNTHWEETTHKAEAERFRDALYLSREKIAASKPDVVLILGSNHFRGFWLDLIPAFTLGVGECISSGESGTPKGPQRVDVEFARHLANELIEGGRFDLAYSARLQIDHGQSHAIQYLLVGIDVPIVPLVVNVFAPPLPTFKRCEEVAKALRDAVASYPADTRVVVIASGGLSHRLPWPDWRDPHGEDEDFMVQAWLDGRENWSDYDVRRRQIIRAADAAITPEFDDRILDLFASGKASELAEFTTQQIEDEAGNGAQELRTWLMMAAMLDYVPGERLAYEAIPEWLTGMGVTILDPAGTDSATT